MFTVRELELMHKGITLLLEQLNAERAAERAENAESGDLARCCADIDAACELQAKLEQLSG